MKENRIYCTEVSGECQHLMDTTSPLSAYLCQCPPGFYCNKNIAWKPITKDACKNCKEGRYQGLTREQAIEKIAKAICKQTNYQCSVCEVGNNKEKCEEWIIFQYKTQAEAALNALLEGHDDEK